jgi:4,5-DOPA dioxygenase extradiol
MRESGAARFPVLFVSHGSPMAALQHDDYARALGTWAAAQPHPRAVVVVSAHWEAPRPVRVTASPAPATIHDFSGFPAALYGLRYPAPGAPALATTLVERLKEAGIPATLDPGRGLDHGVWVPLRFMYPEADVPVVAVSLPRPATPEALVAVGAALAPLRGDNVLVVGSGGVVHNLGLLDPRSVGPPVPAWARAFDDWVRDRLAAGDAEGLAGYGRRAPHAARAVPTTEHFDPLFVVLGAADGDGRVLDVYEGFRHGSLSLRTFALAADPAPPP